MTIGFLIPADFAGSPKNDKRVLITCTKEKAGILGSGLSHLRLVAGARNAPKPPLPDPPLSIQTDSRCGGIKPTSPEWSNGAQL